MNMAFLGRRWALLVMCSGPVLAVPMLRLSSTVVFVQVNVGLSPPIQTLLAYNIGDGSLSPGVSVAPEITWVTASVGSAQACTFGIVASCIPLQFTLSTENLARGTYTAEVTVSDPRAIDAPQVVVVTVQVGQLPVAIDQYMAPGIVSDFLIGQCGHGATNCPITKVSTNDGGTWLAVAVSAMGTTIGGTLTYYVQLAPPASMVPGTYTGVVAVDDSIAYSTIPVTMRLTTRPIAVPSTAKVNLRLAQGGPAMTYPYLPFISLRNTGPGALTVQNVTATGTGVGAYQYGDLAIVSVDPSSLAPGTYSDGLVTIQCNAADCPVQVPVSLEIVPQGPPLIFYQGVVDNATFAPGNPVAQGDVAVVKGEQLSLSAPASAPGVPLPTTLGGARVLVNGVAAPLYYTSFGQIAFQMPSSTAVGTALVQVERDGQPGNIVTATVAQRAPAIVVVTDASYNLRDLSHPTTGGETLIFWAIGLGPTDPAVPDGAAAPANPPAPVTGNPRVQFYGDLYGEATGTFAFLSPGAVGLYQVNVPLPAYIPKGTLIAVIQVSGFLGNEASIAVQ
jgi:uncharacterized protein (TIGR03437 family)